MVNGRTKWRSLGTANRDQRDEYQRRHILQWQRWPRFGPYRYHGDCDRVGSRAECSGSKR